MEKRREEIGRGWEEEGEVRWEEEVWNEKDAIEMEEIVVGLEGNDKYIQVIEIGSLDEKKSEQRAKEEDSRKQVKARPFDEEWKEEEEEEEEEEKWEQEDDDEEGKKDDEEEGKKEGGGGG